VQVIGAFVSAQRTSPTIGAGANERSRLYRAIPTETHVEQCYLVGNILVVLLLVGVVMQLGGH
jgi:hypothetical protein